MLPYSYVISANLSVCLSSCLSSSDIHAMCVRAYALACLCERASWVCPFLSLQQDKKGKNMSFILIPVNKNQGYECPQTQSAVRGGAGGGGAGGGERGEGEGGGDSSGGGGGGGGMNIISGQEGRDDGRVRFQAQGVEATNQRHGLPLTLDDHRASLQGGTRLTYDRRAGDGDAFPPGFPQKPVAPESMTGDSFGDDGFVAASDDDMTPAQADNLLQTAATAEEQGAGFGATLHEAAGDAREGAQGGADEARGEASGLGSLGVSSGPGESGGGPDHGANGSRKDTFGEEGAKGPGANGSGGDGGARQGIEEGRGEGPVHHGHRPLASIPNFGSSILFSSEVSDNDRLQAIVAAVHSTIAVDENLGCTPQREQSKKVHEASARSTTRSPTRLL